MSTKDIKGRDRIRIVLFLSRRQLKGLLALALAVAATWLGAETMTMTTYYPSPSGIYKKLVSTMGATFARDGGDVVLAPSATGKVGIGTATPGAKLDVAGDARVTGTATIAKLAGTLEIAETAEPSGACAPNGRLARDAAGGLISCQSGQWAGTGAGGVAIYTTDQQGPGTPILCGAVGADSKQTVDAYTRPILFGHWTNPQCGAAGTRYGEGNGWHIQLTSCGTGLGNGYTKCLWVMVGPKNDED